MATQYTRQVVEHESVDFLLPALPVTIPSVALERKRGRISALAIDLASMDQAVIKAYADRLVSANHDRVYCLLKRLMDVIGSLLALVLSSPLILIIALLIQLDSSGPILFRQQRVGKDGKKFTLLKFRTMFQDADRLKSSAEIQRQNKLRWPDFKIENDPRVTRVGRVLRRYSLDEIPNFINVLRGEMSLVGPRPTSFHEDKYDEWHKLRLKATPGVTGLHQVNGRSDLEFDERVRLDIDYINRQCLLLDTRILLKTASIVCRRRGAY